MKRTTGGARTRQVVRETIFLLGLLLVLAGWLVPARLQSGVFELGGLLAIVGACLIARHNGMLRRR